MQFDSFADFIAMGGHGPYVWMAYGATFLVLAACYLQARRRFVRTRRELQFSLAQQASQEES